MPRLLHPAVVQVQMRIFGHRGSGPHLRITARTRCQRGVEDRMDRISAYVEKCPDSKIVLMGYSQGAQVIGDILGGGGGECPLGIPQPVVKGLDPNFAPAGTGACSNDLWPRQGNNLAGLNKWSHILRSRCNSRDPVCAGGSNDDDHTSYFETFTEEAAKWVEEKL
ncbi:hypothetical protein AJ80_08418 [Polytolypa hystricis UAMH7299]|uniref:Cutinase n=1 Tax=Polytolypa hystricis (strain UAMH7299) TaxID=1447883 RepID=A0A2B7X889_POLH7|nr:hypothetical protein AJ80_08418 [Polytolypa hystricis UAMH7299]